MSKRNKKQKQFMSDVATEWDVMDDEHFSAQKGKKPRSRERKKLGKRAFYDD